MGDLTDAIRFITELKTRNPQADKEEIQQAFLARFRPERKRSLFIGRGYSMRFSETKGASFSNTVLSLSAVRSVDDRPVVVCVVGPAVVRFLLANATFIRKISHSSHRLRVDDVKGSFNGTDILTSYGGIANQPENFEQLGAIHAAFTWAENLERIVEATTAIVARNLRFDPTPEQRAVILAAPERAAAALTSVRFTEVDDELRTTVRQCEAEILRAAAVENVNLRGNAIERLVTGGPNAHALGDLQRPLDGGQLLVDVKTKLSNQASAPKAYNIDKMLAFLAAKGSVFAFLVLGIDVRGARVTVRLVPALDQVLLGATTIQHHWAGRSSRGVTQLMGRFDRVLASDYSAAIDIDKARAFLLDLLAR